MTDLPEILAVPALAEHLGMSVRTVMRAVESRDLRASKIARRGGWVVTRADVLEWLDARANRPAAPSSASRIEAPAPAVNARAAARRRSRAPRTDDGTIVVGADWGKKAA